MKRTLQLLVFLFLNVAMANGQNGGPGTTGALNPKHPYPTFQNGNGTLGQMHNQTACGLNYTSASQKLGQRFHNASFSSCVPFDGVTQPATLAISGIPACFVIEKAYLWCGTSGNGGAITATLQNPLGGSANFPMTVVGSDFDKGWGATGSYTYRADVTSAITGNGNYIISGLPTYPNYPVTGNDVDGATLFIIYRDLNATYSGTIVIDDGCMVGGFISHTVSGFNACATTSNANGFLIVADMQDVNCSQLFANEITIGSTVYVATQEDWWNAMAAGKTITAGQTSMYFDIDNFWTDDLYNFLVAGVYYQTTSCVVCAPTSIPSTSGSTAATCGNNDGTATVTPSGGTIPYTYSWNAAPVQTTQTATGLAAGTYTVTITDANGCKGTKVVTVTGGGSPPVISVNPSSPAICNGNSVSLTASGGTTYTWNPVSGLSAGSGTTVTANPTSTTTYTVTGTNGGGCSNTTTVTVTVNAKPTIGVSPSAPILCNGQSVSITASGASTYTWNPVTGLSAGSGTTVTANPTTTTTYTVTGTNGSGCTNTSTVTVTVNNVPTITVSPTSPALCNGQSVVLTAGGGNIYIWNPASGLSASTGSVVSANPSSTTSYTVTGTDANGCSNTAITTVTINPLPSVSVLPSAPILCNGQSVSLTAGGANTYVWNPATGLSAGTGATVTANPTATTTYTVTGTSASGCTNTTSVTVTINAKPTITVAPPSAILCNGQSTSLTAGGGSTYVWSPTTGLSAGTGTVVSANPTSTSTYTVTGTDGNGCTNTTSVTVTVNQNPTITVNPVAPVLCNGQSVSLTAGGGNTYAWSPVTGLSAGSGSTVSANPSTTTSYTVTGTNGNGCTNTATTTVTVNALPTVTVSPVAPILCNGQSVVLTAGGGTGYVWSPTTGLSAGSGSAVTANPGTTTSYTVTGTDANGCTNTASATVNINPKPTVNVSPAAPVLCTGQSTALTASGANTYIWSPGTGLSGVTGTIVSANPSSTTTYTVTGTDANGCTNTTTVTVTVNAVAIITVNPTAPAICNGSSVSLTAGGGNTYAWNPVTGLSAGTGTTVSANPTGTTTYTVTGTAGSGCTGIATVTVTVNNLPNITVSPVTTALCNGQSVPLTAGGGTTYTWSPSTGLSAGSGTAVTANPSTTTSYTVTGTDANGCTNTASTSVTVNALPVVTVSPVAPAICLGQSTSLTGGGANTYIWSPTSGLSAGTGTVVSANPTNTAAYTVTGTDANGCSNTASVTVTVNALPVVMVSPAAPAICAGNSTSLTGGGATTYAWSPVTGLSAGSGTIVSANPAITTAYVVTGTDAQGCSNTASVTVTVNALPVVTVSPAAALCIGQSTSLTGGGATTYTWSPTTGLSSGSGTIVSADPSSTTIYTVTGTDANGCSNTASTTVTVNALPVVTATSGIPAFCNGLSTSLTGGGASTYTWSPATGLSGTNGTVVTAGPSSTTTYTVTGTDANGCSNTTSVTITVNPLPQVNAGPDLNICPGSSAQIHVTGAPFGSIFTWLLVNGLTCNNCADPVASPLISTTYVVRVTSPEGCSAEDTVDVLVTLLSALAGPDTTLCYGSTADLHASGGSNFDWQPTTGLSSPSNATTNATPFLTTTYTVTVTSGACSATATATVTILPEVTLPVITQAMDTLFCSFDAGYNSYQWYFNSAVIPNATGSFYKATQSGNYNVAVTDTNGCEISVGINIVLNVGLESLSDPFAFSLSPNPATNELMISGKGLEENASVIIFNTIGEKVFEEKAKQQGRALLDVTNLSAGIYFISVQHGQSRWVSRFVKE